MRNKLLDALFPSTRQAILAAVLLEPEKSWCLSDLTSRIGRRSPSSLQRELASLVAAEIVLRREEGNRVYFQANRDCPVFAELAGLMAKTAGLADVVRSVLAPLAGHIRVAWIHGSIARGQEHAASDIDLVVVGNVGLSQLSPPLRIAETRLDRTINATVYAPAEFASKAAHSHFLASVLGREKLFLIGSEHDLAELVGGRPAPASRHEPAGAG